MASTRSFKIKLSYGIPIFGAVLLFSQMNCGLFSTPAADYCQRSSECQLKNCDEGEDKCDTVEDHSAQICENLIDSRIEYAKEVDKDVCDGFVEKYETYLSCLAEASSCKKLKSDDDKGGRCYSAKKSYETANAKAKEADCFYQNNTTTTTTTESGDSECADGCTLDMLSDDVCDSVCNVQDCFFDFGDCIDTTECATGCPVVYLSNGYCDESCYVDACDFDEGDCE